jgi:flagellar biosynthetic protein FliO
MNPERGRSSVVSKVKQIRISSVLLACLFLFLVSSPAQETQSGTGDFDINKVREAVSSIGDSSLGNYTAPAKENINYTSVVFRIVFYLALIVLLILGLAWFMRKAGIAGTSKIGGGGAMDVLEVLPFGQNRNAILIRVMDSVYLLGQTPNSIVLLEKIEGQRAIDLIASSKGGSSITQFRDAFNNFIGKIKKPV